MQTLEQFGQTIKAKYPQYKDMSDTELGQKMLAKYPQYSDMVQVGPPPQITPKSQFFGDNPNSGLLPWDKLHINPYDMSQEHRLPQTIGKTIANQAGSVTNLATGIAGFFDPVKNAKTIGGAIAGGINYNKDVNAQSQSEQGGKDYIPKLQAAIDKNRAAGKDTTQLERVLKEAGGAPNPISPMFNTQVSGEFLGAAYQTLAPGFIKKGVAAGQQGGIAEGIHAGVQSIAEDPQQLAPYFLMGKGMIEKNLPGLDKSISNIGGGPGGLMSKGLSYVKEPIKNALQVKYTQQLYDKYNEIFTGTKSAKKTFDKSVKLGKDPAQFGAENGYIVDVQKGKYNSQPTMQKVTEEYITPRAKVLDDLLAAKDKTMSPNDYVSLDDIAAQAKKGIEKNPLAKGSGTLSDQQGAIDKIIAELKLQYGDKVPLKVLNDIKKAQWAESSAFDLTKPKFMGDVNYQIGSAAKDTIQNSVPEASIKQLNSEIGDASDFNNNLRKIDGGAVKGGRLGGYFARTIGAIAGSHAGPFGTIVGALAGNYISELMQNNAIAGPMKRSVLESITPDSSLYEQAQSTLKQLQDTPAYPEVGKTTQSTTQAADLGQKPMPGVIKINYYKSQFPKYLPKEMIDRGIEMLKAKEQAGHTLDMKTINSVVRQIKQMSDIKLNPGVKNNRGGNVIVRSPTNVK